MFRSLEEELDDIRLPPIPAPHIPAPPKALDLKAARAAGFKLKADGDLCILKGIGPQAEKLLKGAGILSFEALAAQPDTQLRRLFQLASPRMRQVVPVKWQAQAQLARDNRWVELRQFQEALRKA